VEEVELEAKLEGGFVHFSSKEFFPAKLETLRAFVGGGQRWVINSGIHKKVDRVEVRNAELVRILDALR
jgi:hypothetical protein